MERRRFLAASATVITVAVAGCGSPDDDGDDDGGGWYSLDEPKQMTPQRTPESRGDSNPRRNMQTERYAGLLIS